MTARCVVNVDYSRVRTTIDDREYYLCKILTGDKGKAPKKSCRVANISKNAEDCFKVVLRLHSHTVSIYIKVDSFLLQPPEL